MGNTMADQIIEVYGKEFLECAPQFNFDFGDVYRTVGNSRVRLFALQDYSGKDPILVFEKTKPVVASDVGMSVRLSAKVNGELQTAGALRHVVPASLSVTIALGRYAIIMADETSQKTLSDAEQYYEAVQRVRPFEAKDNVYVVTSMVQASKGIHSQGTNWSLNTKFDANFPAGATPSDLKVAFTTGVCKLMKRDVTKNFKIAYSALSVSKLRTSMTSTVSTTTKPDVTKPPQTSDSTTSTSSAMSAGQQKDTEPVISTKYKSTLRKLTDEEKKWEYVHQDFVSWDIVPSESDLMKSQERG